MVPIQLLEGEVKEVAKANMVALDMVKGLGQVQVLVNTFKEIIMMVETLLVLVELVMVLEEVKLEGTGVLLVMGRVVVPVPVLVILVGLGMDRALEVQVLMETVVAKATVSMVGLVVVTELDLGMAMPTHSLSPSINVKSGGHPSSVLGVLGGLLCRSLVLHLLFLVVAEVVLVSVTTFFYLNTKHVMHDLKKINVKL
jgi:hypothetical protein